MHVVEAFPQRADEPIPDPRQLPDGRDLGGSSPVDSEHAGGEREIFLASYGESRRRAIDASSAGRLQEALGHCDEALRLAERIGDQDLLDQAYCNRSELAWALGQPADLGRLRELLMRNRSYEISFSAAYQLAQAFTRDKNYKKALFYARIALDRAKASGNPDFLAKGHNEIGNGLLAESYFTEAIEEYEKALELVSEEPSPFHLAVFINLGYSRVLLREFATGFGLLYKALRLSRRLPAGSLFESWAHLGLAFAFLERGRLRYAWKHGKRGLELAEDIDDSDAVKTGLYLMGEIEKTGGDIEAAFHFYSRLQEEFSPEMSNLATAMLHLDTKQLVNLRA